MPRDLIRTAALAAVLLLGACAAPVPRPAPRALVPAAPVAAVRPHAIVSPQGTRNDDYYWLRDDTRTAPEVLAYLNAENAYTDAVLGHTRALQETLYAEMVARIDPRDYTVPVRKNGYWYYQRFERGRDFPIVGRKRGTLEAREEVLVDANARAAGKPFYALGETDVSVDGARLAWTEDDVGRRQYVLRFRDLARGADYPEAIANVEPEIAWAGDNATVLYVEKDRETLLGVRVKRHLVGTDPAADAVVYEEPDHSYQMRVTRSRSDEYLFVMLESTLTSEQRVARADDPALAFAPILPRQRGHEYEAEDRGDRWLMRTNDHALNFRLVEAPMGRVADRASWRDVLPARDDALVGDFQVFARHVAVEERSGGLARIRVVSLDDATSSLIAASEPAFTMSLGDNPEVDTTHVRYRYTSLVQPTTTFDYDMPTGERRLLKQDHVLGGYEPERYASELLRAPARDGAPIPVSIVYRRDGASGPRPLLLLGYGAYGLSRDPAFDPARVSLLDRGFAYAIAHVRGGSDLGRAWYEDGKLLRKQHTFDDFVDATEFLVKSGRADPRAVFAVGRSAGGLLIGAVANQRPDLYRGMIAGVPFVDAVTTGLDESIPLTSGEFDEWGDPRQKAYYDYMLGYSPYDNVRAQRYPAMLVTTGLWDSQVQYYEPAKWVAKLRATKLGGEPLLLKVDMSSGHGGKAGRFEHLRQTALEYAFVLDLLARDEPSPTRTTP